MNSKTYAIGILTVTAVVLFLAQFIPLPTAGAADVIKDRDYSMATARAVVGGETLYVADNRLGMIAAFGKIAGASAQGVKPAELAGDISFALWTTAIGLFIAIPLVLAGNMLAIRIGKLQDGVQEQVGEFLDRLAAVQGEGERRV